MTVLEFREVGTRYVYGQTTLKQISFQVTSDRIVCFFGSGSDGQYEALRAAAGLTEVTAGAVRLDGRDISRLTPAARPVRLIFQNQAYDLRQTVTEALLPAVAPGPPDSQAAADLQLEAALDPDRILQAVRLFDKKDLKVGLLDAADRFMLHVAASLAAGPKALLFEDALALFADDIQTALVKRLQRLNRLSDCLLIHATSDRKLQRRLSAETIVFKQGRLI